MDFQLIFNAVQGIDMQSITQTLNRMDLGQLDALAKNVVTVSRESQLASGFEFTPELVAPYLTGISSGAMGVKSFVQAVVDNFYPFIQGGGMLLFALKFAGSAYKTMLGHFKEAVADLKWAALGLMIIAFLPKAIDLLEPLVYGS